MEEKKQNYNPFFRQFLFIAVLVVVGLILFRQLQFFIGAFLGAVVFYIVFRNLLFRMTDRCHWRRGIAAAALTGGMSVILIGIGFLMFKVVASEITNVDASRIMASVKEVPDKINGMVGFTAVDENVFAQLSGFFTRLVTGILNSAYSFAGNVFMMLVILYFMLAYARKMEQKVRAYIPFRGDSRALLSHEVRNMIYSNAVGIPLVMLSQGIAAGILYWALGLHNSIFWAFVTAFCGLIPMIGTVIVSVPLGLSLIAAGQLWPGIVLMGCGLFVVANVDNLIRIIFLGRVANTPPLVVIFGVILGIPLFGFWGIIFGPLLISGFLLLIKIYYVEYGLLDASQARSYPGPRHPGERGVQIVCNAVREKCKRK